MRSTHLLFAFSKRLVASFFQLALFQLLLALNAIARPGNGFQPLGIDLIAAAYALAKSALADPQKSCLDHLQQLSIVVALRKQKLLGVGAGRAVGDVLRSILVGNTTVFFRAADRLAQALLPLFQPFFKAFQLLLVHVS